MQTRTQRLPRWLSLGILAIIALPAIVGMLYVMAPVLLFTLMPYDFRTVSKVSVSDLAKDTGLSFPPDARITHFKETPPIDPVWVARVVMSSSAEADFSSSVTAHPDADVHVIGALSDSISWWKPLHVLLRRTYHHAESSGLVTVVVSQESGQTVAYIEHGVM